MEPVVRECRKQRAVFGPPAREGIHTSRQRAIDGLLSE